MISLMTTPIEHSTDNDPQPSGMNALQYLSSLQSQRRPQESAGKTAWPSSRNSTQISMRTGCAPCLQAGRECRPDNPACIKHVASEDWKLNRAMADQHFGSWRDRAGLHMFIRFTNAPERNGLFRSPFWHSTVVTACMNHEALFYVCSGIGHLHDYVRKREYAMEGYNSSLYVALQQCNQSITLLTSVKDASKDPEMNLIACVLFICFEALHGHITDAIQHCMQGRKLLALLETSTASRNSFALVNPSELRPIIIGHEIQARCVPATSDYTYDPLSKFRAIRLPVFGRLYNLDDAHFTLHAVYIELLDILQEVRPSTEPEVVEFLTWEVSMLFLPWLTAWHQSFSDLLDEHPELREQEKQRIDVLQLNYILLTISGSIDLTNGFRSWPMYCDKFRSMVDLSASLLRSCKLDLTPPMTNLQFPFLSQGLWVTYPLFLTMARCTDHETRWQAAQMLQAYKQKVRLERGAPSGDETPPNETDTWTTEDWVPFLQGAPIDVGSAMFFGGFRRPDRI